MFWKVFLLVVCVTVLTRAEEVHKFFGKHFVASYLNCDPDAIGNIENLMQAMDKAVGSCGATVLNKNHYVFHPNGLTAVYLLSESHASIHTYPEFRACFVDLFTCGDNCSAERFDEVLRAYLNPKETDVRFFARDECIKEISYFSENEAK